MRSGWLFLLPPLLAGPAAAQELLEATGARWAIGSLAACARTSYEVVLKPDFSPPVVEFHDGTGRFNSESLDARGPNEFSTTTLASPDVPAGTRWTYRAQAPGQWTVRNLSNGRQFALVRCPARGGDAAGAAPTFSDPVALVTFLVQHATRQNFNDNSINGNVFSPGLRNAIAQSAAKGSPDNIPCGLNANTILNTQEAGILTGMQLTPTPTGPDRVTVAARLVVDGSRVEQNFMTVRLDGAWKLENIVVHGSSWRRALDCKP